MNLSWLCRSDHNPDGFVGSSALMVDDPAACVARDPVPFRLYMGRNDPRNRGQGEEMRPDAPDPLETTKIFAKRNRCSTRTEPRDDNRETHCTVFQDCAAPTELCLIDGLAHNIPEGPPSTVITLGPEAWRFFRQSTRNR